jgi:hypothetical protein
VSGRGKRIAIFGVVAVGVVGIAGSAMGAGSSSSSSFLNDFARRLGVSPSKVQSAYKGAMADRLNQLVKEGKITKEQAQQMQKHMQSHQGFGPGGPMGGGGFGPRMHGGFGGGPRMHGGMTSWLKPAASYLGITTAELQKELMSGKTPAQIATAHGKTAAGLEAVLVAEAKKPLQKAVTDGKLTSAQATRIEKFLTQRVDDLVQHGFHFHHFGGRHDGWGGPPPPGKSGSGKSDSQGSGGGSNSSAQTAFGL